MDFGLYAALYRIKRKYLIDVNSKSHRPTSEAILNETLSFKI